MNNLVAPAQAKTLRDVKLHDFAIDSIIQYGTYVIENRALPDFRDGLKPVQRRNIWAMYSNQFVSSGPTIKCARIVGEVVGKFHPHGDCLHGDTRVLLCNGKSPKIKNLLNKGKLWVWAINANGEVVPALAHSWRVGQVATKLIKITMSSGENILCSLNHPFLAMNNLNKSNWIKAENLKVGDCLIGGKISGKNYRKLRLNNKFEKELHCIAGDYLNERSFDEVYHHKNHNSLDNRPYNIEILSKADHAKHHKDYLQGLSVGRKKMFFGKSKLRQAIKMKNAVIAVEVSKNFGLYVALKGLRHLLQNEEKLTIKNYNNLIDSKKIYNLTRLSTLKAKGISFKSLKKFLKEGVDIDTSKAKGLTCNLKNKTVTSKKYSNKQANFLYLRISQVLNSIEKNPNNITWDDYAKAVLNIATENHDSNKYKTIWCNPTKICKHLDVNTVQDIFPLLQSYNYNKIIKIEIVDVAKTDLYDFTVNKHANMLVYTSKGKNSGNVLVAHNSSVYEALVNLAKEAQPLIVPQGAFGMFNTKYAAARYTEAKLHKYSEKILLNKNYMAVTSYMKNYDGNFDEPMMLPALLPNLLINGVEGIAVGVVVGVPPFAAKGVVEIVKKALKQEITAKDCVKHLKINYPAPFQPEVLTSDADMQEFFKTGQGSLKLGVGYQISDNKMTITRFPPHFKMENAIKKLNTFDDVSSAENHNNKDGKKLIVTLKTGIQMHGRTEIFKKLANALNENLVLRVNVIERISEEKVQFTYCTMPEMIHKWTKWRLEIEVKRHIYEAKQLAKSIANLELQVLACLNIDKIVPIIKSRKPDVDERLAKALKITLEDAKYILSLTLRRLTGLSLEELKTKIKKETAMRKASLSYAKHPADKILADIDELTKGLL